MSRGQISTGRRTTRWLRAVLPDFDRLFLGFFLSLPVPFGHYMLWPPNRLTQSAVWTHISSTALFRIFSDFAVDGSTGTTIDRMVTDAPTGHRPMERLWLDLVDGSRNSRFSAELRHRSTSRLRWVRLSLFRNVPGHIARRKKICVSHRTVIKRSQ